MLTAIFPNGEPRRDAVWAQGLAEQLTRLQRDLAEYGLDFAAVARAVTGSSFEPERWEQLASLETLLRERLSEAGLTEPGQAKRSAAEELPPPAHFRKIILAGVLDPMPLVLRCLERWSASIDIEVLVHAGDVAAHDGWGRPVCGALDTSRLPLEQSSSSLRVLRDPAELAEQFSQVALAYRDAPGSLALACADPRLIPVVAAKLKAAGLASHDPAGLPLGRLPLGKLVRALAALGVDESPEAAAVLLCDPFFGHLCTQRTPAWTDSPTTLSRHLDELREKHLPSLLADAIGFARKDEREGLASALSWMAEAGERLRCGPVLKNLERLLGELLGHACPAELRAELESLAEQARVVRRILGELILVEERHAELPSDFWLRLVGRRLLQEHVYPEKQAGALDLQGWLELVFADAPHLCVAGLNEGLVPETIRGDMFLPESLRRHLGMRSNADRFARDRLILEAALRSRQSSGRVDILLPKLSADGDPLQPSRLLFACGEDELVERAKTLFTPLPPPKTSVKRSVPWKLRPWKAEAPSALSPSALRSYLDCPFRYYLEKVLRMERPQIGKRDLDALDFGNLCHAALERFALDKAMLGVREEADIAEYLVSALQDEARKTFGELRSFALRIQIEAAAARLRAAAAVEAAERAAGWSIFAVEKEWSFSEGGFRFHGRIDRIDRHEDGRWRILDYKTSDAGSSPDKTHWGSWPRESSWLLPEMSLELEGKRKRWIDLQLPLYLLSQRAEMGTDTRAGYFLLPKTKEDCAISLWSELTPEHLDGAARCAQAVARAISEGRFWPPAPKQNWDEELERLFPDGLDADVDPAVFPGANKEEAP